MTDLLDPDAPAEPGNYSSGGFYEIPLDRLRPHPGNVRRDLGDLGDLAASIAGSGILEPLLVTRPDPDGFFTVVAGHRRLAAAQAAGTVATAPCVVRDLTEAEQIETMLVENLQRTEISPAEEAQAYLRLTALDVTVADIAAKVGRPAGHVKDRLALMTLDPQLIDMVHDGRISLAAADVLVDHADDDALISKVVAARRSATGPWRDAIPELNGWISQLERDRALAAAVDDLRAAGITRFDKMLPWGLQLDKPAKLSDLRLDDDDTAAHTAEPCHQVHLRLGVYHGKPRVEATSVCINPRRHTTTGLETDRSTIQINPDMYAANSPATGSAELDAAQEERNARRAARVAAARARGDLVANVLSGDIPVGPAAARLMHCPVHIARHIIAATTWDHDSFIVTVAGPRPDDVTPEEHQELRSVCAEKFDEWSTNEDDLDKAVFAIVATWAEQRPWTGTDGDYHLDNEATAAAASWKAYLELLVELGHEISPVEAADLDALDAVLNPPELGHYALRVEDTKEPWGTDRFTTLDDALAAQGAALEAGAPILQVFDTRRCDLTPADYEQATEG